MVEEHKHNECYNPDCDDEECYNPQHFNFICLDPRCEDLHCEIQKHYDKQLLKDFQEHTDFTKYDHTSNVDYSQDVDVKICHCDDCADEDSHKKDHHHEEDSCSCHDEHHHHDEGDSCSCHDEHHHHDDGDSCSCHDEEDSCECDDDSCSCHDDEDTCECDDDSCSCHDEHHHHDDGDSCSCHDDEDSCSCHDESCSCHDDGDIRICHCDDCADDDEEEEDVIAEGKPLLSNKAVQIIVSSGILFVIGHILEYLNVADGNAALVVFMVGAFIAGYPIAKMAYKALFKRHTISPAVLMCIACVASFLINCPEEGAAVTFLYYIAEFLEDYAEQRAKHSIKSLIEIAPSTAIIKTANGEETFKIDDVHVGDIAVVKPGDKIPLDGKIVEGISTVDQSSITGESVPVTKSKGNKVFAGTINKEGYLEVEVTKEAKNSVISKIVQLVKLSQLNRSNTESYVEKIAKYYTPIIVLITICVAFIPPLFFGANLVDWVYRALSIMVISCPCAFLISTPIGMVSSITSATRHGVIIKGSTHVEEMRNIKVVIFDKTGTLTEGKLEVNEITLLSSNYTENDIVEIAASLEAKSSHPIADAITRYAYENNISPKEVNDFKNVPGKGVVGEVNNKTFYASKESLIEDSKFNVSHELVNRYSAEGKTVIFVGNKDEAIGIITVSDKIREESPDVIHAINSHGIKTVMLTGDNMIAAKSVGEKIGIQYVFSNLLPEDKLNILDTVRNKFGDVAMVGDGINDAPALARANIGIAMGAVGSDVAIETADVALMQDDLSKLPYLFKLSSKTMNIIRQNITLAIVVKVLFVILAILGVITLMMSVGIGDMGLTLVVILNSFRIGMVKESLF